MKINPSFSEMIYSIRQKNLPERSHSKKVIYWVEDTRLRNEKGKAIVFILPTKGCSWASSKSGGCSICGYIYDNPIEPDYQTITDSLKTILQEKIEIDLAYSIKLFTSGSFLDKKELPLEIQKAILEEVSNYQNVKEVVLESRPEYVTDQVLENIAGSIDITKVEIAIGLESANNMILKNSINKGFFWEDFKKAALRVFEAGGKVKAYLLFKPPFVSEYDSIIDVFKSVEKLVEIGVDTVSINSISIHRGTLLAQLFEKNQYRTPWIWSLVHLCKSIKQNFPKLRVICDIVSGGNDRGAHNCGSCDKPLLEKISHFSLSQDIEILSNLDECSCIKEWEGYLLAEKLTLNEVEKNLSSVRR